MIVQLIKRPIKVDAEQFVVWDHNSPPQVVTVNRVTYPVYKDEKGVHLIIPTLEGNMRCNSLDWIIKGVNGEYYPCKPDIKEKTYTEAK